MHIMQVLVSLEVQVVQPSAQAAHVRMVLLLLVEKPSAQALQIVPLRKKSVSHSSHTVPLALQP